ncbi:hypothetical protein BJV82DRAFT_253159 [Fennellomyces sp. T-0311]|nr:hypothetical protein BJV82DRAFT_253159 [Fennellomyces sp. T-0311]
MQTRDKKRNLFREYRHGNKSMPKLTGHTRQKSTTDDDNDDDDETNKATLLETALEKANAAVLLDSANNTLGAIDAYEEAVRLLKNILRTASQDNHTRLQKIDGCIAQETFLIQ